MRKTTIYLDTHVQEAIRRMAKANGRTNSAVIRDAVMAYAGNGRPRPKAACVGSFRSGRPDLSRRCEDMLDGFGEE